MLEIIFPKFWFTAVDYMKGGYFKHDEKIIACGGSGARKDGLDEILGKTLKTEQKNKAGIKLRSVCLSL